MPTVMTKGRIPMEIKKLSISAKRQITIPKKFFTMLGFDTEAECTKKQKDRKLKILYQEAIDKIKKGLYGRRSQNRRFVRYVWV